ncbi:mannose/cellobiose epimerase-like protein (N-acyl-D-glucosamine 2-epimerase family) [Catalinimonas alkaloidigena]|uniref:AGE family epimerase/isomerase n=1 Tax=Catalinimonas alkaloidigena TaxID=1075417 RepID=UPI0024061882|nr:AGE family epimerase/isomerase [Catalinimonas alkaloidigena]MDF9795068.1 mannose/cellobiose epimerase-like protein (N-acyl-D-glucosamine 2-epimerase family) [Catalinimonas alkaloidigena]
MKLHLYQASLTLILCVLFGQYSILSGQPITEGNYWKKQAIEEIIKPWTAHAIDHEYGAYHSFLDQDWKPFNGDHKYPGMIARHLFSATVAYMLSGKDEYRQQAAQTYDYLITHGWDEQYGGWYNELDRSGKVVDASKDLFMQTYAITGLAMYYVMRKDSEVKAYVDRSIALLEQHAWDTQNGGGYVRALQQDLTIKNRDKVFSPQLAPLSGYLLYLYAATRDAQYLQMSERILQTVVENMTDEESGWIMEGYDQQWKLLPQGNAWMNTGHNVEVAWMLMRLYDLTGKEEYQKQAMDLNRQLLQYAFHPESGVWYHKIKVADAQQHSEDSPWWVQAYGNMFQLYLYHSSGDQKYLDNFRKGAEFWNQNLIDKKLGGAYLSALADGSIDNGNKAVRTKTSYHAMEHGLLNYLYLDVWANHKRITLHYFITNADEEKLYPLPIEEMAYEIEKVLVNGKAWNQVSQEEGYISLPPKKNQHVEVSLRKR